MSASDAQNVDILERLGLDPKGLIDDTINTVCDYCADAFDWLEACARQEPGIDEPTRASIAEGIERLYIAFQAGADKNLDRFELYAMNNCFSVPQGLTLPETQASVRMDAPVSASDDEASLEEELALLRTEVASARRRCTALRREVTACDRELAMCPQEGVDRLEQVAARGSDHAACNEAGAVVSTAMRLAPLVEQAAALVGRRAEGAGPIGSAEDATALFARHRSDVGSPATRLLQRLNARLESLK
eukprot:jgi/Mesvir1/26352/Mv22525-RA.1